MLDEVQRGIGRSGHFFAFEESGIKPDAIGMAKGLGGVSSVPSGLEPYAELFQPGYTVLHSVEVHRLCCGQRYSRHHRRRKFDRQCCDQQSQWHAEYKRLKISRINCWHTGTSMVAMFKPEGHNLKIAAAQEKGLYSSRRLQCNRLLPALIATTQQLSKSVAILDEVFSEQIS